MIPQRTINILEDLHMPQMVFYCNILLFVLMSYSHGLFKMFIQIALTIISRYNF